MPFKIIFLLVICFNIFIKGNAKDTAWYVQPHIGHKEVIPIYYSCSPSWNKPDAVIVLDKILKWKPAVDSFILLFEVHTDCRNDSAYNFKYSQRKADSIVVYMKRKCHDSIAVIGRGMGESQLVNHCKCEGEIKVPCSEESHQENRRIVFKIIGRREF